ncbi:TolC family protein [Oxalicibacterium solurbis]|uniref:Cobalt-zinc-cadmium resistance protein n=1 Tax=Oxalicibacterium solurbis TaxID=69280 RepID=A0A8J3AWK4_9BURK|nr:TolC family protein [Oxalicibacterium solurbis]GGI52881.1 cobalt-zinc-cadmium resistance protein [Oxalicibacterium solurbis]
MTRLVLLLAVVWLPLNVAAQSLDRQIEPSGVVTLPQAQALALQRNAVFSAARNERGAAEGAYMQADVLPNPDVSLLMEDTRRDTRTTTLLFNQPIELGGKRAARVAAADRARAVADAGVEASEAATRASVTAAFYALLAAQEQQKLAAESAMLAKRAADTVARRVQAGRVSPVEETRARVAEANVRLERERADSALAIARRQLAATWGSAAPRFTQAEGELMRLPPLPSQEALAQQLQQSPALQQARQEVARRDALARVETSRRTPDVTLSVGVKRDEEMGRNQAVIGVSIPLPFFDRNQGNVLQALRRADQARDELAAAAIRLDSELMQAWQRLANARSEAQSLRDDILPGAQRAYDAAAKGFAFGKFAFLDVLDAQRTLLEARARYLRTLFDAHLASADITRLTGGQFVAETMMPLSAQ